MGCWRATRDAWIVWNGRQTVECWHRRRTICGSFCGIRFSRNKCSTFWRHIMAMCSRWSTCRAARRWQQVRPIVPFMCLTWTRPHQKWRHAGNVIAISRVWNDWPHPSIHRFYFGRPPKTGTFSEYNVHKHTMWMANWILMIYFAVNLTFARSTHAAKTTKYNWLICNIIWDQMPKRSALQWTNDDPNYLPSALMMCMLEFMIAEWWRWVRYVVYDQIRSFQFNGSFAFQLILRRHMTNARINWARIVWHTFARAIWIKSKTAKTISTIRQSHIWHSVQTELNYLWIWAQSKFICLTSIMLRCLWWVLHSTDRMIDAFSINYM